MLIARFHAMVRNKFVWGAFAVIVCISFAMTGVSLQQSGCTSKAAAAQTAEGVLFGDYISPSEFFLARYHELGLRGDRELDDNMQRVLRQRTWHRIAALRMAREYGIGVTDEELSDVIRKDRSFADNGQFNPQRYRQLVENQLHVTIDVFENFLREEVTLQKLRNVLESSIWISPDELDRRLASLTDSFSLDVVRVQPDKSVRKLKAGTEDARAYFEANTNFFVLPETRRVVYVAFPVERPLLDTNAVDIAAEVRTYYDDNIDTYSNTDTNGTSITRPLDEVRDRILAQLAYQKGLLAAKNRAADFVIALSTRAESATNAFASTAAQLGYAAHTSAYFAAAGRVPGLDVSNAFTEAAFVLAMDDPERSYSDVVAESNAVYVLAINDIRPPRIPAFEDVAETVMPYATSNIQQKAMEKLAVSARDEIVTMLKDGKTFTNSVRKLDLNIYTSLTCSVYSGMPEDFAYGNVLAGELVSLKKGDVSKPILIDDGYLLAYVSGREPGEFATAQMLRPQVVSTLDRYRAGVLYPQWCDYVLARGSFEDLTEKRQKAAKTDDSGEQD